MLCNLTYIRARLLSGLFGKFNKNQHIMQKNINKNAKQTANHIFSYQREQCNMLCLYRATKNRL